MKRFRRIIMLAAFTAVAAMLGGRALAQESADADLVPLDTQALEDLRGGFFTVNGITFDFGAVVRTTVDGQPALETRLTWTPEGMVVEDLSAQAGGQLPGVGGWGLDLSDATGTTLVGHRLLDGQLQGFIVNTGDNRNIRQDIEVSLVLPGLDAMQRDILNGRLGMAIDMDMSNGLLRATGQ